MTTNRVRRPWAQPAVVALCLTAGACGRPSATHSGSGSDAGATDGETSSAEMEKAPTTTDCRSWDGLDLESLPPLPPGPHVESFDRAWTLVATKHYDPTLSCLDWPEIRSRYGAKVAAAQDDVSRAYAAINEMLALLGQSHLHATAPTGTYKGVVPGSSGPARPAIEIRYLENEAVVTRNVVDGHEAGVPMGSTVVSIAGNEIDAIAEPAVVEVQGRKGTAMEVALGARRAISAHLRCPEGGTLPMEVRRRATDGSLESPTTHEIPCFVPEGEVESVGNLRGLVTRVEWRMLDPAEASQPEKKIGYLAFNYWMLPMVQRVKAGMSELRAQGMNALIVDLRGNPGGVGAMSVPVARLLIERGDLGRLQMRGFNQDFKVEPAENEPAPFDGPVVVLVDEGTASTSEIFALGLQDLGRVRVVGGSPSAGMALPSLIEPLPDGGMIQYVVGDYHSAKGSAAEGGGVVPDHLVDERGARFVGDHDPVLEAAAALLREGKP